MKRIARTGPELVGMALAAWLLAGCASPKAQFTDADWVSDTTTGRSCYQRGDFRRAAEAFARAEQRARALDDADGFAVAAVNRAICLLADGQAEAARAGVDEALADARVSKGRKAELMVAGARAELALGKPDQALALDGAALNLDPLPVLRAQARLGQSAAALAKDDSAQAAKELSADFSAKEWAKLPNALRAEYAVRRAEIAAAENRPAEAAAFQDQAAGLWRNAGRLKEMALTLAAAGQQAQASGDLSGACDRFYRAAHSLWAQGFQAEAERTLEEGVACAKDLKDKAISKRMAELSVTFKNAKRLSE